MEQKKLEEADYNFGFEKKFEEAERICRWREMQPGYWYFVSKEVRGMNKWQKPITVVTVKFNLGGPSIKFYAPPSLHYGLESRPDTTVILYEGMVRSETGYLYPKFKYAS